MSSKITTHPESQLISSNQTFDSERKSPLHCSKVFLQSHKSPFTFQRKVMFKEIIAYCRRQVALEEKKMRQKSKDVRYPHYRNFTVQDKRKYENPVVTSSFKLYYDEILRVQDSILTNILEGITNEEGFKTMYYPFLEDPIIHQYRALTMGALIPAYARNMLYGPLQQETR